MEQWTGSKLGKEYVKAVYCHPAYLIYMQSTLCKMPAYMNYKLESRLLREISIASDADDTTLLAESEEEQKNLLIRVKEESEKAGLKLNNQKTKVMAFGPITSCQIEGEKVEERTDFIFLGTKITVDSDCSYEIKRRLLHSSKAMTNLDSELKKQRYQFFDKGLYSQSHGSSSSYVMYGCESWSTKMGECRIDAFKLWCWRRLLRVPWTARDSN